MVPNKLKRHLEQNHSHVSKKSSNYFTRLLSSQKKNSTFMEKCLKIFDKSLLCSFKISELIVKKNKSHAIGEELILPAC